MYFLTHLLTLDDIKYDPDTDGEIDPVEVHAFSTVTPPAIYVDLLFDKTGNVITENIRFKTARVFPATRLAHFPNTPDNNKFLREVCESYLKINPPMDKCWDWMNCAINDPINTFIIYEADLTHMLALVKNKPTDIKLISGIDLLKMLENREIRNVTFDDRLALVSYAAVIERERSEKCGD